MSQRSGAEALEDDNFLFDEDDDLPHNDASTAAAAAAAQKQQQQQNHRHRDDGGIEAGVQDVTFLLEALSMKAERPVLRLSQLSSSFFVLAFRQLFGGVPEGVNVNPVTAEDRVQNARAVIESLESKLDMSLGHINAELVSQHDEENIAKLLRVFVDICTPLGDDEHGGVLDDTLDGADSGAGGADGGGVAGGPGASGGAAGPQASRRSAKPTHVHDWIAQQQGHRPQHQQQQHQQHQHAPSTGEPLPLHPTRGAVSYPAGSAGGGYANRNDGGGGGGGAGGAGGPYPLYQAPFYGPTSSPAAAAADHHHHTHHHHQGAYSFEHDPLHQGVPMSSSQQQQGGGGSGGVSFGELPPHGHHHHNQHHQQHHQGPASGGAGGGEGEGDSAAVGGQHPYHYEAAEHAHRRIRRVAALLSKHDIPGYETAVCARLTDSDGRLVRHFTGDGPQSTLGQAFSHRPSSAPTMAKRPLPAMANARRDAKIERLRSEKFLQEAQDHAVREVVRQASRQEVRMVGDLKEQLKEQRSTFISLDKLAKEKDLRLREIYTDNVTSAVSAAKGKGMKLNLHRNAALLVRREREMVARERSECEHEVRLQFDMLRAKREAYLSHLSSWRVSVLKQGPSSGSKSNNPFSTSAAGATQSARSATATTSAPAAMNTTSGTSNRSSRPVLVAA